MAGQPSCRGTAFGRRYGAHRSTHWKVCLAVWLGLAVLHQLPRIAAPRFLVCSSHSWLIDFWPTRQPHYHLHTSLLVALLPTVLADVKRCLPTSVVLELAPGAAWRQSTHAMLLRGSLAEDTNANQEGMSGMASPRASYSHRHTRSVEAGPSGAAAGSTAAESGFLRRTSATGDAEVAWEAALVAKAAAPQAPRVMPWLWCPRYHCNLNAAGRMPDSKRWKAGSEGALLLVCLTEAGELTAGVAEADAEAAAARAAAELLASQQAAANSLRSHPLDVLAGGSGSGGITLPAGAAAAEAAGRSAPVEPLSARGPAEPRPSGLRCEGKGAVRVLWLFEERALCFVPATQQRLAAWRPPMPTQAPHALAAPVAAATQPPGG